MAGAHQIAYGIRAVVRPGRVEELRALLDATPGSVFAGLPGVHFGRLLLLEAVEDIPATLVLMTEVDAPLSRHVRELEGSPAMEPFALCEEPVPIPPQAAYVNTIGRTLDQIRGEEELRAAIAAFLDRTRLPAEPLAARAAIRTFVRGEPSLAWALSRAPRPPLRWRAGELGHALGVAAALAVATPVLLVVMPVWALALRWHEARDPAPHIRVDPDHAARLGAIEDHGAQNQFSAIGFVKPGWLRQATIAAVLWLIDGAARHVFRRADLAGVKTIHFARWTMLDGRRRAIFTSNYDGSLESYMDDFIDKVAFGLNASFSHGVGFPRTRFLLFEGARREEEFKDYLRRHQIPTQVWYSAYDRLTAANVENNALIRSGLSGSPSAPEAAAWLRRL